MVYVAADKTRGGAIEAFGESEKFLEADIFAKAGSRCEKFERLDK